ncbi:MAG: hypothetical protein UX09_C0001G0046 [Candidatus Uhrbacteria bacterium GW2011_GWE2_45_35]|uniref:Uncharacterized protein n=1 Tax=Candidatus Uhrbacteria bacterium GW2011_GWE2_45_35 TaxID=1618993 RepID=A0A0G1MMB8_9BACT|nr:MAG: hypothetical protein UX09_C0001G0046 [Candidatus Uhrbacteria bacterium GW2011_GWE2_45_35]HBR80465.1 hypothetical protein [Candidatus Uhrbacteria bacterium]HCU31550.1 hypothetical protein [Candidatus Uhrbacteria bacterium]
MILKLRVVSILCLAWVTNWISLIASFRLNPVYSDQFLPLDLNNQNSIYATGGFPFKVYDYPRPPMGPGPEQSELPFVLNFVFWLVVIALVFWFFKGRSDNKNLVFVSTVAAFFSTLIGVGYLLLKFD